MGEINWDSILKKVDRCLDTADSKKKIDKLKDDAILRGVSANGKIHSAEEAGAKFGHVLRQTIQSSDMPERVIDMLENYDVSKPFKLGTDDIVFMFILIMIQYGSL